MLAVVEAARSGSMAAAADRLGVTHGAISRRIQAVEHWLGCPVFERGGRGVRLTAQGSQFVRRAERGLGSIEALRAELSSARSRALRISALPSLARLWLLPRLQEVESVLAPGQVADILADHRLARLDDREADIAIRFGHGGWADTRSSRLFGEYVQPVASRELAERLYGLPATVVMKETLIHDSDGSDWRQWSRAAGIPFAPAGPERRFVDHDLALAAAAEGMGIALARLPLAGSALTCGRLVALDQPGYEAERGHHAVIRVGESRRSVLAVFDRLIELGSRSG
jgi:DNA-binding transcriptional LysR family regulator